MHFDLVSFAIGLLVGGTVTIFVLIILSINDHY
jgi:hypothetical protein